MPARPLPDHPPAARPLPRRAVIVSGDLHNVGDLALLMQTAAGLRRLGIERLAVRQWNGLPDAVTAQLREGRIRLLDGKHPLRVAPAAAGALVVIGGGQMARDNASLASLASVAAAMRWARLTGGHAAVIGCGVDPLTRPSHRRLWRGIIDGAALVTVRDESAQAAATAISGRQAPHVPLTADLMFMPSPLHDMLARRDEAGHIVVAPCVDAGEGRSVAVERLAAMTVQACDLASTERICLIAHDARAAMDMAVINPLAAALARLRPGLAIRTIAGYRLDEVLRAYASARLTITNRLHPAIFSLLAERPILIVDDGTPKLAGVAARFGVTRVDAGLNAIPAGSAAALLAEMTAGPPAPRQAALAAAKGAALRNFDLLADALGRGHPGAVASATEHPAVAGG